MRPEEEQQLKHEAAQFMLKRVDAACKEAPTLARLARSAATDNAMHTGCGLLNTSAGARLDYDNKFVPVAQTRGARRKLADAFRAAYSDVLAEKLDDRTWELGLAPLEFGGANIARLSDVDAAASFWATWHT